METSPVTPKIRVRHLDFYYGAKQALMDISIYHHFVEIFLLAELSSFATLYRVFRFFFPISKAYDDTYKITDDSRHRLYHQRFRQATQ